MEAPGSVVLNTLPRLPVLLESILQNPPYQRNDHRSGRLGDRGHHKKVDAILSTEFSEPSQVSRCPLHRRRSPDVRHINEAHPFEHQTLDIARHPGKLPSKDGPDGT
jgi:hypothetical protein